MFTTIDPRANAGAAPTGDSAPAAYPDSMLKTTLPRACHHARMTYTAENRHPPHPGRSKDERQSRKGSGAFDTELLAQLPDLRSYALSLTHDPNEANDLVQDCMLKALEKRHQYQADTFMRRWLFTILRNRYLDNWRQRSRRGSHMPVEECTSVVLSRPASQDDWMELRTCQRRMAELGTYDRAILLLSVFSRLSQKEIAARFDVAEGTIRSRLSRARAFLRAA